MSTISPVNERPDALIAQAARETGADFDFMVRTAARESGFDPRAQARTSSAAGLYQFLEQTWLGMMHTRGAQHGYAAEASAITRGSDGRYAVTDPARRQDILDMRFDPRAAALMAGELASANSAILENRIGRTPTSGELYAAHFLGAGGAGDLIEAAASQPTGRADALFPAAARANRPIFYDGGRPRSASEVLDVLTGGEAARPPQAWPVDDSPQRDLPAQRWVFNDVGGQGGARSFSARSSVSATPAGAILSPAVVEILASLDAPARGERET
ncbi:hypothetical protein [Hyphobacterium marinum]|uniref:Transglycosylase SLT domain-containing protein n=1 Tax=Hyphobacterium marinum TaxID=3116574 RepID=A0ABU7M1N8_9PROT|nr:hypothetical protein [Hyphobacterium sp. Y6023]MEE2567739.1 hypothetical protein [Hyphobacterium sp. Y6023]